MMKIGFIQLNSCGGCFFSILGSQVFTDLLKSADIRIFRLISEIQDESQLDVLIVEGGVTREDEAALLRRFWTEGTKIIALGSCAVLGGVMSGSENMNIAPIDRYVDPDIILPGCPPPQRLIGNLLLSTIDGTEFELSETNVCAECPFNQDQTYEVEITKLHPTAPPKSCFLREGVICLGPITRAGCEAQCIKDGIPCDGCMGSPERNLPAAIANLFSILKVSPEIQQYAALAFRYQKPELRPTR
jgi:coenzyme F420-reducing hydrogenase gamma subunit